MIVLGLLLLLAATGLSFAAIQANRGVFDDSAGVVGLLGYSTQVTIGEVFLAGAAAGALALLGLVMMIGGLGRSARRRAAARRELRRHNEQAREAQRRDQAQAAEQAKQERAAARAQRRAAAEEQASQPQAEEREEELASR